MVRFATTCDRCGRRSEEYSSWPSCRDCNLDICPFCDSPSQRSEDEANKTQCRECEKEEAVTRTWLAFGDLQMGERFLFHYNPLAAKPETPPRYSKRVMVKDKGEWYHHEGERTQFATGQNVAVVRVPAA